MVQGVQGWAKRYVEVHARWRADGRIEPLAVVWGDGRRYDVQVGGKRTHLWLEDVGTRVSPTGRRWFVEEVIPE